MISKSSTILLGIIAEKPINPYEITKLVNYLSGEKWLSLAPSSIYAAIKTLQDKDYIAGKNIKAGNMPEKTVYTITEEGQKQLHAAIEEFLGDLECDCVKFNIAIILICHIEKEKALKILQAKVERLGGKRNAIQARLVELAAVLPAAAAHGMKHMIYLTDAEIQSMQELIATVTADGEWNHFLARDTVGRISHSRKGGAQDV